MLTKNGKILVGNEIKNWLDSLLPAREVTSWWSGIWSGMLNDFRRGDESDYVYVGRLWTISSTSYDEGT
jgi:hypothetical protein